MSTATPLLSIFSLKLWWTKDSLKNADVTNYFNQSRKSADGLCHIIIII